MNNERGAWLIRQGARMETWGDRRVTPLITTPVITGMTLVNVALGMSAMSFADKIGAHGEAFNRAEMWTSAALSFGKEAQHLLPAKIAFESMTALWTQMLIRPIFRSRIFPLYDPIPLSTTVRDTGRIMRWGGEALRQGTLRPKRSLSRT